MVVGTLRIPVSPDRCADVLQILQSVQGPVSAQPGCAGFHVYQEVDPEPAVVLVERWESDAALEEHIRSEAYRRILCAIEYADRPPEVCFEYLTSSEGLELIKRLRELSATEMDRLRAGADRRTR